MDSPSFTPSLLATNGTGGGIKTTTISPKAANAAPFMPKGPTSGGTEERCLRYDADLRLVGTATPPAHNDSALAEWAAPEAQEFLPHIYEPLQLVSSPIISSTYNLRGAPSATPTPTGNCLKRFSRLTYAFACLG